MPPNSKPKLDATNSLRGLLRYCILFVIFCLLTSQKAWHRLVASWRGLVPEGGSANLDSSLSMLPLVTPRREVCLEMEADPCTCALRSRAGSLLNDGKS